MKHAFAVLLALAVPGCSAGPATSPPPAAGPTSPASCTTDRAAGLRACITDREWVVEDVAGTGIIDFSRVTVTFAADGSLSGLAGCNRYHGSYELDGDRLRVSPLISTRKACVPALMNQEAEVLRRLESASGLRLGAQGELRIGGADGTALVARHGLSPPAAEEDQND